MRYKFRGKRIDNGNWAYGYYAVHRMMLTGEMDYFIVVDEQRPQSVDPDTVGQYTGLKDRNGKEIYEGDIVTYRTYARCNEQRVGMVSWCEYDCGFSVKRSDNDGLNCFDDHISRGCEIIGNVYQHPHLLTQKEA